MEGSHRGRRNAALLQVIRRALIGSVAALAACAVAASSASAYIYISDPTNNSIDRATLDGTQIQPGFIQGVSQPAQVAVDGNYVYWLNEGTGSIGRANLDGSAANPEFIPNAFGTSSGLAVDDTGIYWTNFQNAVPYIGRATLDGTQANPQWLLGAGRDGGYPLGGVAVDGTYVYWLNLANPSGSDSCSVAKECETWIGREALDGSTGTNYFVDTGVSEDTFGGGAFPGGSLVTSGGYLYWSQNNNIARVSVTGAQLDKGFGVSSEATAVAVDSAHVYWTDMYRYGPLENQYYPGEVDRSNLDGTNFLHPMFTEMNVSIEGLAVDGLAPPAAGWPASANPAPPPAGTGGSPGGGTSGSSGGGSNGGGSQGSTTLACVVPKLKGLTLGRARQALANAHCGAGKVTRKRMHGVKRGHVGRSNPGAGRHLAAGARVALVVAR